MANSFYQKYFLPGYSKGLPSSCWPSVGADIGITNDHTVITAIDKVTNKQIFYWRFCPGSSRNWHLNYDALEWVWNYFKVPLRVDCTGAGSHLPNEMPKRGVPLEEWGGGSDKMKFTEQNKPIIMDNLSSLIGGRAIELFNLPEIKNELAKMQRTARESGGFKIAAGKNGHDDIPISLGLTCMGVRPLLVSSVGNNTTLTPGAKSVWQTVEW